MKEQNEPSQNPKWMKYLKLIDEAFNNYKECELKNCSCYKKYGFSNKENNIFKHNITSIFAIDK